MGKRLVIISPTSEGSAKKGPTDRKTWIFQGSGHRILKDAPDQQNFSKKNKGNSHIPSPKLTAKAPKKRWFPIGISEIPGRCYVSFRGGKSYNLPES